MNYYLLLAHASTGKVLLPDGKTLFSYKEGENIKYPYIITPNLEEAEKKAFEIVNTNSNLEVGIFDSNEVYIKTILGNYIPPPIKKDKWWKFW